VQPVDTQKEKKKGYQKGERGSPVAENSGSLGKGPRRGGPGEENSVWRRRWDCFMEGKQENGGCAKKGTARIREQGVLCEERQNQSPLA